MGAVTTLPAFLTALQTNLAALGGLSGVNVYTAPVDEVSMGQRSIVFCPESVTVSYEYQTMPRTEVYEEYEVPGFVWVSVPGAGETQIAAARTAAFAILEAVHDYVAGLVGKAATQTALGVDHVKVAGYELEQVAGDGERHALLTFTVSADAYFTPA